MSSTSSGTPSVVASLPSGGATVLTGTPVVPGAVVGPVVRPAAAVRLPEDDGAPVDEQHRAAEQQRFAAAAAAVAARLAERAVVATGVSAEVLAATAGMAGDRGLLSAVEQQIG